MTSSAQENGNIADSLQSIGLPFESIDDFLQSLGTTDIKVGNDNCIRGITLPLLADNADGSETDQNQVVTNKEYYLCQICQCVLTCNAGQGKDAIAHHVGCKYHAAGIGKLHKGSFLCTHETASNFYKNGDKRLPEGVEIRFLDAKKFAIWPNIFHDDAKQLGVTTKEKYQKRMLEDLTEKTQHVTLYLHKTHTSTTVRVTYVDETRWKKVNTTLASDCIHIGDFAASLNCLLSNHNISCDNIDLAVFRSTPPGLWDYDRINNLLASLPRHKIRHGDAIDTLRDALFYVLQSDGIKIHFKTFVETLLGHTETHINSLSINGMCSLLQEAALVYEARMFLPRNIQKTDPHVKLPYDWLKCTKEEYVEFLKNMPGEDKIGNNVLALLKWMSTIANLFASAEKELSNLESPNPGAVMAVIRTLQHNLKTHLSAFKAAYVVALPESNEPDGFNTVDVVKLKTLMDSLGSEDKLQLIQDAEASKEILDEHLIKALGDKFWELGLLGTDQAIRTLKTLFSEYTLQGTDYLKNVVKDDVENAFEESGDGAYSLQHSPSSHRRIVSDSDVKGMTDQAIQAYLYDAICMYCGRGTSGLPDDIQRSKAVTAEMESDVAIELEKSRFGPPGRKKARTSRHSSHKNSPPGKLEAPPTRKDVNYGTLSEVGKVGKFIEEMNDQQEYLKDNYSSSYEFWKSYPKTHERDASAPILCRLAHKKLRICLVDPTRKDTFVKLAFDGGSRKHLHKALLKEIDLSVGDVGGGDDADDDKDAASSSTTSSGDPDPSIVLNFQH